MKTSTLFRRSSGLLVASAALGALLAIQSSDSTAQEPARVRDTCLECHDGMSETLLLTPHAMELEDVGSEMRIACSDCHGSDSRHWEEDPEQFPMVMPSELTVLEQARLCSSCHVNSHQQSMLEHNPDATNGINCSACHTVHDSRPETSLLRQDQPDLCYSCHPHLEGQYARSSRHPMDSHTVTCTSCHLALDERQVNLSYLGTNVCAGCHAEFEGPFPYQHAATLDFSTEEGGCMNCHAAHGSDNPQLLTQPYETPHFQLCTQCHVIPPGHNANSQHGTAWLGQACHTCHSDIHGSYTNRFFLSESLATEGCLNAGCHGR